ncbi:DUF6385 domain-containing protein [Desulfosporosinus nitroreducens]|uniref:DUF6385 domain-containing protein n=1 Tax=Desulfosporosinus nitroreducens TaxID=2018668 RepID=A0ABT8QRQ2_9FIRM|nr:DUF6385 domain-containing protein [Desulfosporosinus nitroreducens]MDO0823547.1 DUF6385 domain-containing protein [Desulfosporosinus nitroreducens]
MKRNIIGTFNRVPNGNFLKKSETKADFPEAWFQIGGNKESSWNFKHEPWDMSALKISNTTAIRAGIIQSPEASLGIDNVKEWIIKIILKADRPNAQAYLRIYPISSQGDVAKPWEYCFGAGLEREQFQQVISADYDVDFLRLETGILGAGSLCIYKIIAYSLSPNRMKRRVKKPKQEILHINSIQTIGEIIKPIQLATPIPLKIPVNVQAHVNADVRNLTPIRDKVQIFGNSQVPIATSVSGRVQVEINGHGFYESLEDVTASETISSTITRDISALLRCSFAVCNFGSNLAYVDAELSPDGIHWTAEDNPHEVGPGKLVIISPKKFLRYTRLTYKAENLTSLRIWVQAQN